MKKWKRFCRNSFVKTICILLTIASVVTIVGSSQWFINYMYATGQGEEVLFEDYNRGYQSTEGFADQMEHAAGKVLGYVLAREIIDTDMAEEEKELTNDLYQSGNAYADPTRTNLRYFFLNPKKDEVYTNNSEWQDAGNYETYLKEMQEGEDPYITFDSGNWVSNVAVESYGFDHLLNFAEIYEYYDIASDLFNGWIVGYTVDVSYPAQDVFQQSEQMYESYRANAEVVRDLLGAGILVLVLCIIILSFGLGETSEGSAEMDGFDRIKTELAAALLVCIWGIIFGCGLGIIVTHRELWDNYVLGALTVALPSVIIFLIGYTSLLKRLRAHTLWKNSILYMVWKVLRKVIRGTADAMRDVFRNLNLVWKAGTFMTVVIVLHWLAMMAEGLFVFICLILEVLIFAWVIRRMIGEQKLLEGMRRVKSGELEEKIDTENLKGSQKEMAELMNHVEDGLQEAIDKQMRSERMKTELITNVSHDIKTPLTSIINYVDLLRRETKELDKADPQKVEEYLEVLDQKSQRLKILTEDVVEASRISSGNISLENTNLDLVEMLTQIEGEYLEKLEANGLEIIRKMPDPPVTIYADGRRVWRVFGNLYQNTAKYAMPNTRVYVTLEKEGNQAVFTMKNISEAPLNIDPDELMERFTRGDEARTTEGSGLGLSIARSLTEAMKGRFTIYLDGDLFKVTVCFPLA